MMLMINITLGVFVAMVSVHVIIKLVHLFHVESVLFGASYWQLYGFVFASRLMIRQFNEPETKEGESMSDKMTKSISNSILKCLVYLMCWAVGIIITLIVF